MKPAILAGLLLLSCQAQVQALEPRPNTQGTQAPASLPFAGDSDGPTTTSSPPLPWLALPRSEAPPPLPPPLPGELLITELLIDPAAVPDQDGEWLELLNLSGRELDLQGLELRDCGQDHWRRDLPFRLGPGQRVVLGAAPEGRENGGAPVELVWEDFRLGNERDCVILRHSGRELDRLRWEKGWKIPVGASLQLDQEAEARGHNEERRHWCRSRAYGDNHEGDRGGPGKANHRCRFAQ